MVVTNTTDIWSAAATVIVVVALSALTAVAAWEHDLRREEHRELEKLIREEMGFIREQQATNACTARLNLYFQALPKGREITWKDIPSEYWTCMPKNLIEQRLIQ